MDYRIYSIHGTFAADTSQRGDRWWQKESTFSEAVLSYLDTERYRIIWQPFRWSGANKNSERCKAAIALSQILSKVDHRTNKVALIGHSHGGNVANFAKYFAKNKSKIPDLPLVTLGTPFVFMPYLEYSMFFEKIMKFWWVLAFVLVTCLTGLFFTKAGTLISTGLVIFSMVSFLAIVLTLFFKYLILMFPTLIRKQMLPKDQIRLLSDVDQVTRLNNIRNPKIYSLNDEAINALSAASSQEFDIASADMAVFPTALVTTIVVFVVGILALPKIGIIFSGDVVEDFRFVFTRLNAEQLSWLNDISRLVVLLALSNVIGFLCSRLFFARWAAQLLNKLFAQAVKRNTYGWDSGISNIAPMVASANLPLTFKSYDWSEEWKPLPKSMDDDLDNITASSAAGMFRSIREALGVGLTTGSYTFTETITTNFRGDELVHSAYFEHPDMPGFLAWILCEFYGFPKGKEYSKLPIDRFQEWWDAIRPDRWRNPAKQQGATGDV